MDKKTKSGPMRQILDRLKAYGEMEIIVFGSELILDESISVENWPRCDSLIAFASGEFPIDKAVKYVDTFRPFCINDVASQVVLKDRIRIYRALEAAGVPLPKYLSVLRGGGADPKMVWTDDYVEVDGRRLEMPVVEKPLDADDHNIVIYYGKKRGSRRLFRKEKDRSSLYTPDVNEPRTDGSYLYEEFMGNGRDLKVYTVGPYYAHGEQRRSPAVDGIVRRDRDNKELRLDTPLTPEEREIAHKVAIVFKQNICGFDIIRWKGKSYVIDVNGWSFVKGNIRYYDKVARIMRKMILNSAQGRRAMSINSLFPQLEYRDTVALYPALSPKTHSSRVPPPSPPRMSAIYGDELPHPFVDGENSDVLRAMVTIFRHADRTPKHKVKVKVSQPELLYFCHKDPSMEKKYIGKTASIPLLCAAVEAVLAKMSAGDKDSPNPAPPSMEFAALTQIRAVLQRNRRATKVQLKPKKVDGERVVEALLVCKWGGETTHAGILQAHQYTPVFWEEMLPPQQAATPEPGAHRIQKLNEFEKEYMNVASTQGEYKDPEYLARRRAFCQGLKVYSSDEARVRMTAKVFVQATFGLSTLPDSNMVRTDDEVQSYLDDLPKPARAAMDNAHQHIRQLLHSDKRIEEPDEDEEEGKRSDPNAMTHWAQRSLRWLDVPCVTLAKLFGLMRGLQKQIARKLGVPVPPGPALAESMTPEMLRAAQDAERKNRFEEYSESESEEEKVRSPKLLSPTLELCQGETLLSLKERWDQLVEDMFVAEKQAFLHTKIPDVYDNIKYDAEHNSDVLERIRPLYRCAKRVADFVVPQEYGVTRNEKLTIGRIVVQPLLNRMVRNLETGLEDQPASRAFFYFSSESHLHCLRNVLLLSGIPENETVANILESLELHYMSHCVFRLYEDLSRAAEDPLRFYVNVQFSPGAALDPFTHLQNGHMTPVSRPVPVVGRMSFAAFKALLANS